METTINVSRKCKALRVKNNVSRAQLSYKTGLSTSTINRIENAEFTGYNPHLDTLTYLANGFNKSLSAFLTARV